MKYNDLTIQKLRDLSILDVATKLGFSLKGTGQEGRRAVCPYHADKHPSLHFSRKKNIFKCFVCGAKGDLFKLVMDHESLTFPEACDWLIKEFNVTVVEPQGGCHSDHTPACHLERSREISPCATLSRDDNDKMPQEGVFRPLDSSLVTKSLSVNSLFCQSLVSTGYLTEQQMFQAADRYHLGISKDGGVVFWEIDDTGVVHNGKIMFYLTNCHRDKSHTPTWVVAKLKKSGHLPSNTDNPHCLFGLHLLNSKADPLMGRAYLISPLGRTMPIAIVESEKTAVICSVLFPEFIWMASGGKTMLNASLFAPLGNRRIVLFPDTDETGETYILWTQVASEATKLYKSRIHVSNLLELHATASQKAAKIDIVDFLFPTL